MREAIKSDDDVAIDAAKEKLVALRTRPGFEQAMKPEVEDMRSARIVAIVLALVFVAVAAASFALVGTAWLRWLLVLILAALAIFATLAAIGFAREKTPDAVPSVVAGKSHDPKHDTHQITLLDETGTRRELIVIESVWAVLRAGDVGVAHVKPGSHPVVIEFHRL